jgi:hypothetical protein
VTARDVLVQIRDRMPHEPCCDHSGRDEHGCWDCYNTGHAHAPYDENRAATDLAALVEALESVLVYIEEWEKIREFCPTGYALGKFMGHDDVRSIIERKLRNL